MTDRTGVSMEESLGREPQFCSTTRTFLPLNELVKNRIVQDGRRSRTEGGLTAVTL